MLNSMQYTCSLYCTSSHALLEALQCHKHAYAHMQLIERDWSSWMRASSSVRGTVHALSLWVSANPLGSPSINNYRAKPSPSPSVFADRWQSREWRWRGGPSWHEGTRGVPELAVDHSQTEGNGKTHTCRWTCIISRNKYKRSLLLYIRISQYCSVCIWDMQEYVYTSTVCVFMYVYTYSSGLAYVHIL